MIVTAVLVASGLAGIDAVGPEPVAQYECVLDQVSAADRRVFTRPSPDPAALAAVSDRVRSNVLACAARYGWDGERQRLAATYSRAAIVRAGLRAYLVANRIDVAVIDRWAEGYSNWSDAMDNVDIAILRARLVNAGVSSERITRFIGEIGQYLEAREMIAAIRLGRPLHSERISPIR